MRKDLLEVPQVPPRVSREGNMLGKIVNLKFVDHDITDEQPFTELAREKKSDAESVSYIGARIAPNINLYKDFNRLSNMFGGYKFFMIVNKKESD